MKRSILLISILCIYFSSAFNQVSLLDKFTSNNHDIIAVAMSSDGNYIASSGYDESIIVRDKTGELVKRIKGHKTTIVSLAFSPDGNYIAGAGYNKNLFIWEIETGILRYKLAGHKKKINSVDISINGIIASGSEDQSIIFWDLNTGQKMFKIQAHKDKINSLCFSRDGSKLVSGGMDKQIKIWDGVNGALQLEIKDTEKKAGAIKSITFSPDGKSFASSDDNGRIIIWNINGIKKNTIILDKGDALSIDYSPDGRYIAVGTSNKQFIIYDSQSGSVVYNFDEHVDKVYSIVCGPNGKYIVNCDFSNNLYLWDVKALGIQEYLANLNSEKNQEEKTEAGTKSIKHVDILNSDVDKNIPLICRKPLKNRYALIIGNEDYNSHQMGLEAEVNVDYAINDAKAFNLYAKNVLCIPEDNIMFLTDAKAIEMHRSIEKLNLLCEISGAETELYFYYAGHGFPDEQTKEPFIIPVDVSGNDLRFAISVKDLYTKLTEHPHKSVTVFLDACFTGGARNQGLVSARAIKVKPREDVLRGNLIVFSASSGQESSLPYHDKKHGMFTYHLLKKLQESKGIINYQELADYLKLEVGRKSILINDKPQNPQINVSPTIIESWKEWKF